MQEGFVYGGENDEHCHIPRTVWTAGHVSRLCGQAKHHPYIEQPDYRVDLFSSGIF